MKRLLPLSLLFFLLLTTPALSQVITGKVVHFADGDTITILDSTKTQYKIRLYGIDTPEKSQAFGNVAKEYTSSLTASRALGVSRTLCTLGTDLVGCVILKKKFHIIIN